MSNNFNLQQCLLGLPMKTKNGQAAKFIAYDKSRYPPPCPLTVEVDGKMESYTKYGEHLEDSKLDLVTPDPIDWNIDTISVPYSPKSSFLKTA